MRQPVQSLPCTETSSSVQQKLTFRLWHSVPLCKTSYITLLWERESLSSRSARLSVIFPWVRQWFLLWPCHFTGNGQHGPAGKTCWQYKKRMGRGYKYQLAVGWRTSERGDRRAEGRRAVKVKSVSLNTWGWTRQRLRRCWYGRCDGGFRLRGQTGCWWVGGRSVVCTWACYSCVRIAGKIKARG